MEFRILGPLEVVSDGQAFDLGGANQRALLGFCSCKRTRSSRRTASSRRLGRRSTQDGPEGLAGTRLGIS